MTRLGLILILIGALIFAYAPIEKMVRRRRWLRYVAACGLWSPAPVPPKPAPPPVVVYATAEIAEIYDRA
ncbi:hypothetical protein [Sphingomonas sp. HMP6]|uniref:hypothetical protein n=1 Tax=Sphingomonas sp. HMP6 TaxID=1517551 RepID=UPI001596DA04|nr:hypothetical protein [Sphingomonas sp. HMP6]BCA57671.1 hypothetical protein HMP06_0440 [Sphingomonas sp. HMP6]